MTKAKLRDIKGNEKGSIDLPKCFSKKIRSDIVGKVLEAQKSEQPYGPSPVAGKQHSASGKIIHRRHVWKTHYGKGISRVPRKIMSNRGSQFNWVAATIPSARGGRRAHPPKVASRMGQLKINKKELVLAIQSALTATTDGKIVSEKYQKLNDIKINTLPIIIESKITEIKIKELLQALKVILGEDLFEVATRKKKVRAGKGKSRGRKYKSNAGLLFVQGKEEKLKTNAFEVVDTNSLSVTNLAKGGLGRLTVYTETAIKELGEKYQ